MTQIRFYDPSGSLDASKPYAKRLDTLAGKRIGFLSNAKWQAYRTLPLLRTLLARDFATVEVLSEELYPQGNNALSQEEVAGIVAQSGVDAVIVGNAA